MILVEVRGRYLAPDGTPRRGEIRFTPRPVYVADQPEDQALTGAVTAALDWRGEFTVLIAAGDDADLLPTEWTYEVVERFEGQNTRRYDVLISSDYAAEGVDLADVAPTAAEGGVGGVTGPDGDKGWAPVLAGEVDGERRVLKLVDWTGGEGAKPAVPANAYVGASGLTTLASAVNVRGGTGGTGPTGPDGWEPVLAIESDGARRVLKIVDWTGGGGTKPTVPTPNYIGASGLTTLASAIDIRGPQGIEGPVADPDDGSITNAKLASMANGTLKGRASSGSGAPEDLSASQAKALLAIAAGDVSGLTEAAQDAVGTILGDTATVELTYDDAVGTITAAVPDGSLSAAKLSFDVATQTELTAHIDDTSAAHAASAVSFSATGNVSAVDVQAAIAELDTEKAPVASPTFTGTPAAPTATAGTNTTQIATTAFVKTAVDNLVDTAPGALNTLNELAAALGDDADFAGTMTTALAGKQPLDSDLTAIGGLSPTDNDVLQRKSGAWTNRTPAQVKTDLSLTKSDVGLGNVDNTADTAKPVSTAQQTALDLKAPLASPALTGNPTAPTQTAGNNSTRLATTAYTDSAVAAHVDDTSAAHAASAIACTPTANLTATDLQGNIDNTESWIAFLLSNKANLTSPALTGNPTAPTQTAGTNNTRIATTAYADAGIVANSQTGTTYTLVLADQNKVVECTNASAITLTVPPNSSVAFPVGTVLEIYQGGAGQVTVSPGSGVTVRAFTGSKTAGQYASVALRKRATDEWVLSGGVA